MNLVKIVNYEKPYKGKDGKDHPSVNYYLEFSLATDNGGLGKTSRISIVPKFDKSLRDWYALDTVAELRVVGKKAE